MRLLNCKILFCLGWEYWNLLAIFSASRMINSMLVNYTWKKRWHDE